MTLFFLQIKQNVNIKPKHLKLIQMHLQMGSHTFAFECDPKTFAFECVPGKWHLHLNQVKHLHLHSNALTCICLQACFEYGTPSGKCTFLGTLSDLETHKEKYMPYKSSVLCIPVT